MPFFDTFLYCGINRIPKSHNFGVCLSPGIHKGLKFRFTSGGEFPEEMTGISLVVHCGGCMLNEREMKSRAARAKEAGVPMTNYGIAIAKMKGILDRAVRPVLAK